MDKAFNLSTPNPAPTLLGATMQTINTALGFGLNKGTVSAISSLLRDAPNDAARVMNLVSDTFGADAWGTSTDGTNGISTTSNIGKGPGSTTGGTNTSGKGNTGIGERNSDGTMNS